jgi:hypothetical protein
MFAYHIDSTTLADGDYQLIPEPEEGISEDPGNITRDLTKAPNPSSETLVLTSLTSAPPAKASPGNKPLFFTTLQFIYSCISTCAIKFPGIVLKP